MRGLLFVNRATVLVLHLRSLEHLVAFSFLARVFVIAWLTVDLRLVEVGIEVARIGPIAYVHDESVGQDQGMAYFGTGCNKKTYDHCVCEKAKRHARRLSGASRRVKEKLSCAKPPIIVSHSLCVVRWASYAELPPVSSRAILRIKGAFAQTN